MDNLVRLQKAHRAMITEQLRSYYATRETLAEWEAEIAESGVVMRGRLTPRSRQISKPTEEKAERLSVLAETNLFRQMRKTLDAIEFVEKRSHGKKAEVLQDYFFDSRTWQEVCERRKICKTDLYKYANLIISDVAELLGYAVK